MGPIHQGFSDFQHEPWYFLWFYENNFDYFTLPLQKQFTKKRDQAYCKMQRRSTNLIIGLVGLNSMIFGLGISRSSDTSVVVVSITINIDWHKECNYETSFHDFNIIKLFMLTNIIIYCKRIDKVYKHWIKSFINS